MEINVRNKSKWKQEGFYVGRPTALANPFRITDDQTREIVIQRYGGMLKNAIQKRKPFIIKPLQTLEAHLIENRKIDLVCHCAPEICHADLIKQVLLNKIHNGYWLINEKCPTCGHGEYKIGIYGI